MPSTNAAKAKPAAPVEAPVLIGAGNSSSPDVQFLVSKRAHLAGALADGVDVGDEIASIDAQLAMLGYRV
jgi:hypothetical protein